VAIRIPKERTMPKPLTELIRVALILEVAFFLAVLLLADGLRAVVPSLMADPALRQAMRELARAFTPIARLPAGPRALAIWGNNLRVYVAVALPAALGLGLESRATVRGWQRLGRGIVWFSAAIAAYVWLSNVADGGLVLAVDAYRSHLAVLPLWMSLLPHGALELFALSWAEALPVGGLLASGYPNGSRLVLRAFGELLPVTVVLLGLAAGVESYISPQVLHALAPHLRRLTSPLG
jgi:uncharacterized membrane protein SpoIIM required for sporulation